MKAWLAQEQDFDKQLTAALSDIPVPDDLQAQLLETKPSEEATSKVVAFPSRRVWLSAAAIFVIAGMLVKYFMFPPPVQFPGTSFAAVDTFRDHMAHFANSRFVLDHMTKDLDNAKAWLAEHQSPAYA